MSPAFPVSDDHNTCLYCLGEAHIPAYGKKSRQEVRETTQSLLSLLHSLWLQINIEKFTQTINFIGASLDLVSAKAYLPQDRFLRMKDLITQL